MPDYENHTDVLEMLSKSQEADSDNRQRGREAHHFIDKRDGQWEPSILERMGNRPRYTFDKVNPIVDAIAGEIEQADFDIKIRPAGGDATKDLAQTMDGMIRNIESMSHASFTYSSAGRAMVTSGIDGWRVVQRWADTDSFEQDLFIEKIPNYIDRVWFDVASEEQDKSDSKWCFVLNSMPIEDYREMFPEGSGESISDDRHETVYEHKPEQVIVGEFYYKKPVKKELVQMTNGAVYEVNDDYEKVINELAQAGITEKGRRTRDSWEVWVRKLDGGDWLDEPKKTVFHWIPVIPCIANFKITENKVIYRGVVERVIDPQRVYNYAKSRQIEEGALAPRAKYWMTPKMAAGFEDTIATLNTNSDPVQFFNVDEDLPGPPQQNGGAIVNPGLLESAQAAEKDLAIAGGVFDASQGKRADFAQSGVAIEKLQNKGDTTTVKYFKSLEIAICHTARILINAIPKVYDTQRQVRVLKEDDTFQVVTVNQEVIDTDTGQVVTLNDLTQGKYDVVCSSGPSFKNRQQETVSSMIELAQVDPSIIEVGKDILLNNVNSPGIDLIADRVRQQLFQTGLIPEDQLTDEEAQILEQQRQQAAQQEQQPDPAQMIAEAEMNKSQADLITAQTRQAQTQIDLQEKAAKLQLVQRKEDREDAKLQLDAQDQAASQEESQLKALMAMQQQQLDQQKAILEGFKTQAETLKTLREAMGVDAIVGPGNQQAYINQANEIVDNQNEVF